jgi:hypothetical protein
LLSRASGVDLDPHERLQRFLTTRIEQLPRPAEGGHSALADAMWAELEGMPTDPGLRQAETASIPSFSRLPGLATENDAEEAPTEERAGADPRLTTTPFEAMGADPRLTTTPFERAEWTGDESAEDPEEQRRTTQYERVSREEAEASLDKLQYQTIQYEQITEEEALAAAKQGAEGSPTSQFDRKIYDDDPPKTAAVWIEDSQRRRWWVVGAAGAAIALSLIGVVCALL